MPQPTDALSPAPVYIGRFAPSPSGPLHFGSLVSAVASYAHARRAGGRWLVRMEDLDPPREQPGAKDRILRDLENHGLHWDGSVLYQSERLEAYAECLESLCERGLAYRCRCTRRDIRAMGGVYDGRCRERAIDEGAPFAWRLRLYDLPAPLTEPPDRCCWQDLFQGEQCRHLRSQVGDPIIKRKDGLFAYQLAVVADDIAQSISHVIRGADLMPVTAGQLASFPQLGGRPPVFGHVPVALNEQQQKLSKQHGAPPLDPRRAGANLWHALDFLQQAPPADLFGAPPAELLDWAARHWHGRVRGEQAPAPAHYQQEESS